MKHLVKSFALSLLLALLLALTPPVTARADTGDSLFLNTSASTSSSLSLPSLGEFATQLSNGNAGLIVGFYIPDVAAYPILQQPSSNAGFVSEQPGTLTQFALASNYNAIGLLGHNYLAGSAFFSLQPGQWVALIYGDGSTRAFKVDRIQAFQALSPNDPYSDFVDLSNPDATLSATDLFHRTYGQGNGIVVMQTCIEREGQSSWGRLFVIASPADGVPPAQVAASDPVTLSPLEPLSITLPDNFHTAVREFHRLRYRF